MDLDEKVREIKKAKDENKLIIFVGAGISKNSDLPDWDQLIKVFVDKLNYPINKEKELSSDEYLKIPQYYYNIYGNEEYKRVIKEELDVERQPNDIHELIFKLNPKHIITTNYDRLLEDTVIEQRMLFDVISKDKDLLVSKKSNYIIKMHGDIKELDNIVLKENDYLNYSQNHILIETYIKSFLVSNTFLFVGYSLNDYNLKQIISWVDYLAKSCTDINDRPKNFIIQEVQEEQSKFIEDYFEKNNIFIINPREIENDNFDNVKNNLSNEFGKRLYATLMYIKDYPNTILDKLYYGYIRFKKCKKVSIFDLFKVYRFKYADFLGGNTMQFSQIDENEYLVIKDIVYEKGEKESFIKEILIKAGIVYISIRINNKTENYNLLDNYNPKKDENFKLSELEIKCNFLEIENKIDMIEDKYLKSYYLFKLQKFGDAKRCLEELKQDILKRDLYELLLYKYNLGLINQLNYPFNSKGNYDDFRYIYENIAENTMFELKYLNDIFNNNKEQLLELSKLRDSHIRSYLKLDNSVQLLGDIKNNLYKMMSIIYDYYFYIRENGIYLDFFNNMVKFFDPFIESILNTYSPKTKRIRTEIVFPDENIYQNYILNIYDIDIIIKYSNYKKLDEYLNKYEVYEIKYEDNINIVEMLSNLCQYIKLKPARINIEYLKKFVLLLTVIKLNADDINKITKILEDVLVDKDGNLHIYIFTEIDKDINNFIKRNNEVIITNSFKFIINELFTEKVYKQLKDQNKTEAIYRFLSNIKSFSYDIYLEKIDEIIKENNLDYILGLVNQLTKAQKETVRDNILINIDTVNIDKLIKFILYNIIEYDEYIEKKILDKLDEHVTDRIENPSIRYFPDPLQSTLEKVVLLILCDKGINISKFKKYSIYDDVLAFIINPNKFEYEKIALDNNNWINVMRIEKYLKIVIEKAKDIISKKLSYAISNGFANEEQNRLYYKYFEDTEGRRF
nr:SIR2 family protein [Clostridioides sp.]